MNQKLIAPAVRSALFVSLAGFALFACTEGETPTGRDVMTDIPNAPVDTFVPPAVDVPTVNDTPDPPVDIPPPQDGGGCRMDTDCDDGNACTTNVCDPLAGVCGFRPIEGCCMNAMQCDDGNTCTTDSCDMGAMTCTHSLRAGCCTIDAECDDRMQCTRDTCDPMTNRCSNNVDPMCCTDGQTRPCYTGAMATRRVGACRDGMETCMGGRWAGSCAGEVLPAASETCDGPRVDENCDGRQNEDCACANGASRACYTGPVGTSMVGICRPGTQSCAAGMWGMCGGQTVPRAEICGNMIDEDCDGSDLTCPPPNDNRANAINIVFTHAEAVLTGSTVGATHDGPMVNCLCTNSANVWYRFVLATGAAVYFDTSSVRMQDTLDTSLFITNGAGTPVPAQMNNGQTNPGWCNDDSGCDGVTGWGSRFQSRTWGYLDAGTYFLAVGGCGTGSFTLRMQHIPTTEGSFFYDTRIAGNGTDETVLIGSNRHSSHCGGMISGEDVRWFTTCGGASHLFSVCEGDGGGFLAKSAAAEATRWNPVLYVHSGITGIESSCSDVGAAGVDCRGRIGANLTSMVFDTMQLGARFSMANASRGINALLVDERTRGSGMQYRLRYTVRDR